LRFDKRVETNKWDATRGYRWLKGEFVQIIHGRRVCCFVDVLPLLPVFLFAQKSVVSSKNLGKRETEPEKFCWIGSETKLDQVTINKAVVRVI